MQYSLKIRYFVLHAPSQQSPCLPSPTLRFKSAHLVKLPMKIVNIQVLKILFRVCVWNYFGLAAAVLQEYFKVG